MDSPTPPAQSLAWTSSAQQRSVAAQHHSPTTSPATQTGVPRGLWKQSTLRKDRQEANIYLDVGVSGGTGTNSRPGWRDLNARLVSGDILVVVAIDRIGRRWMDTPLDGHGERGVGPAHQVRIRSLAQSEATWVTYLASEQELRAVSRRTRAGLERARAEGKTLGPPPRVDDDQVEAMARLRREGQSFRSIGRIFGVSRTTVQRRLQEQEAGNLEDSRAS